MTAGAAAGEQQDQGENLIHLRHHDHDTVQIAEDHDAQHREGHPAQSREQPSAMFPGRKSGCGRNQEYYSS